VYLQRKNPTKSGKNEHFRKLCLKKNCFHKLWSEIPNQFFRLSLTQKKNYWNRPLERWRFLFLLKESRRKGLQSFKNWTKQNLRAWSHKNLAERITKELFLRLKIFASKTGMKKDLGEELTFFSGAPGYLKI